MENQLDELFKSKLAHHATPPSANAWEKLQASLVKKNRPVIIWRLAAALLLMGCLIAALYQLQTPSGQNKNVLARKNEIKAKENPSGELAKSEDKRDEKKTISTPQQKIVRPKSQNNVVPMAKEEIRPLQVAEVEKDIERSTSNGVPALQVDSQVTVIAKAEKPIVLEFMLAPIEPQVIANVTAEKKGLKKFFEKAKDLKNGEGGIDLADFTSKLFASNNKQDKNKESIN